MKKKQFETLFYSAAGIVGLLVVVIGFNLIAAHFKTRADLTAEKAYTLSPGTRAILQKLDTPIKIRLYFSQGENAPEAVFLKNYAQQVLDLLSEYQQSSRGKITVEKYDPQPDSDAEDSARLDGVEGQMLRSGEKFYLGLAVSMLDTKETIPFLSPTRERLLEYDLSRAVARVMSPDKPVIGVMSAMPVFGMPSNPMMARMGQQGQEPWTFISELKHDFTVREVPMESDRVPDEVKVLIVIHPKNISEKSLFALDQFVMRGGKLIALVDGFSLMDTRGQNPMQGGQMQGGSSSLDRLFKAWGIQFDQSKVVADMTFTREVGGRGGRPQTIPTFVFLNGDGINQDDAATAQMDNILLPFAGALTGTPVAGLKETVLLKSSSNSQLVEGFLASLSGEQITKDFKPSNTVYPLGIRLEGKFKTAFPEGAPGEMDTNATNKAVSASLKESPDKNAAIIIGDSDFVADQFCVQVQDFFGQRIVQPFNANLTFAQNLVEQMAGDVNLVGSRSKASLNRPFTRIKKMEAQAQENYRSRIKTLEDSLQETQRKLGELQAKKEQGQRFILSPEQQKEVQEFRKKQSEANKELKLLRKNLRQDIDLLENKIKWFNILGMPFLVALSGVVLAVVKRKRTAAR